MVLFGFEIEEFGEGGEEVGGLNEGVVGGSRFDVAGPGDDHGNAHAAFEHSGLAAAKRRITGRGGAIDFVVHVAAVVGKENDDGIVGEFEPVKGAYQGANGIIHRFDHGGVGGTALRIFGINEASVFFDEVFLGIEGSVDGEHPIVEEEGFVFVPLHEGHGFLGHAVFDVLVGRIGIEVGIFPGSDETPGGSGSVPVWDVEVESVFKR